MPLQSHIAVNGQFDLGTTPPSLLFTAKQVVTLCSLMRQQKPKRDHSGCKTPAFTFEKDHCKDVQRSVCQARTAEKMPQKKLCYKQNQLEDTLCSKLGCRRTAAEYPQLAELGSSTHVEECCSLRRMVTCSELMDNECFREITTSRADSCCAKLSW